MKHLELTNTLCIIVMLVAFAILFQNMIMWWKVEDILQEILPVCNETIAMTPLKW